MRTRNFELQGSFCFPGGLCLLADERPDAVLGEQLQQDAMGHAAVDDDDGFDAGFDDLDAAFDLGDHAAIDGAVLDQGAGVVDREALDELLILVEHAGDVGQE